MASDPNNDVPHPPDHFAGDKPSDSEGHLPSLPIHVVTRSSQLPQELLQPSRENPMVIGFDCEGANLGREGKLGIMQFAFPNAIYLVDVIEGGETLMKACEPALESSYIIKVIHNCKRDSEALYFQFGIKLHNVVDTQIAFNLIKEQEGQKRSDSISFVHLLADPSFGGISNIVKQEVRGFMRRDSTFWTYRPLSDVMIRVAAADVRFLLHIYDKMVGKLNQRSLWHLAVRGALHCRCFCINDNNFSDWPALPPVPETLIAEKQTPEEETLSILDVPPGKMGLIIGKRGANILSIKAGCSAEIIFGSYKTNKVFIIGPVKQVRKAEAMIRGSWIHHY